MTKTELWIRGLLATIISGAAGGGSTGLTAMFVSPEHYNVQNPELLVKMTITAVVVNAFIGLFAYLKQSPLPQANGNGAPPSAPAGAPDPSPTPQQGGKP